MEGLISRNALPIEEQNAYYAKFEEDYKEKTKKIKSETIYTTMNSIQTVANILIRISVRSSVRYIPHVVVNVMVRYATLCYVMLRYATLCYAMLRYAMRFINIGV
jgi:hypothetical protein